MSDKMKCECGTTVDPNDPRLRFKTVREGDIEFPVRDLETCGECVAREQEIECDKCLDDHDPDDECNE